MLLGGLEAGGTKCLCLVGTGPDRVLAEARVPTTTPAATLTAVLQFFRDAQAAHGPLDALGIASFGPLDLHRDSPTFGFITSTPKPGWAATDIAGALHRGLGVPVAIDTDVNAAALGEWRWGAAQGLDTIVYVTVGTGIGGGGLAGGRTLRGLVHPEMGHMRVPHDLAADPFPGSCPFHGDCLEGLASGPALRRAGASRPRPCRPIIRPGRSKPATSRWRSTTSSARVSPERIVLGGGVMEAAHLLPLVRHELRALLNGYIQAPELDRDVAAMSWHRCSGAAPGRSAHWRWPNGGPTVRERRPSRARPYSAPGRVRRLLALGAELAWRDCMLTAAP